MVKTADAPKPTRKPSGLKKKAEKFVSDLHEFIVGNPQFRRKTAGRSETQIHAEIRPLIIRYLENHFRDAGYKDAVQETAPRCSTSATARRRSGVPTGNMITELALARRVREETVEKDIDKILD